MEGRGKRATGGCVERLGLRLWSEGLGRLGQQVQLTLGLVQQGAKSVIGTRSWRASVAAPQGETQNLRSWFPQNPQNRGICAGTPDALASRDLMALRWEASQGGTLSCVTYSGVYVSARSAQYHCLGAVKGVLKAGVVARLGPVALAGCSQAP